MADAIKMLDNGDARIIRDALDEALAATRNNHVDVLRHGNHGTDRIPVRSRNNLHGIRGQAGLLQPAMD